VKTRRHHNNTGLRQVKRGKTEAQVRRIARKLKLCYADEKGSSNG
jgi:hypothetical protein